MGITIQQNKLKYVYITSIVGCLLLWFTIYEYPADQKADLVTDIEEDRLCTPTTYNIGQWIYDPSPFTNIAQKAGYNCIKKKFAHRCFRRLSEPDEIVRSKQMYAQAHVQITFNLCFFIIVFSILIDWITDGNLLNATY